MNPSETQTSGIMPGSSKDRIREQVQSGLDSVKSELASTGRTVREEAAKTGQVIKEEVTSAAGEKIDAARRATADTLDRAAQSVGKQAENADSPRYRRAASDLAHGLEGASQYVRSKSLSDMATDVRSDIDAHPGRWIFAALGVGFVTGMYFAGNGRTSRSKMS
jgi:type IV secretory pathway TrbL component